MKSAALIFGLLAGLLGGVAIAFGNLEPGLATALALGSHSDLVARFILFAIPGIGLLGAGLVISVPRVGAAFMLLSAAAWVVAALLAGHGAVLFGALPFTFVGAGGLVALFAPRRVEEPAHWDEMRALPPPPRRAARQWQDEDAEEFEPDYPGSAPRRRDLRERNEPSLGLAPSARNTRGVTPAAARYRAEPIDEEPEFAEETDSEEDAEERDYIDADPAIDLDPEPSGRDGRVAEDADEEEEELAPLPRTHEPRITPRPAGRPRQDRWTLPDPQDQPPRRPQLPPRYAPERQPVAPTRREPLPPPEQSRPRRPQDDEDYAVDYPAPGNDHELPRRAGPQRHRAQYEEFESYEEEERPNPVRVVLRLLVLLLFALLVGGIAIWIYLDYQRGPQSLLFGNRPHHISALSSDAPAGPADVTSSQTRKASAIEAPAAAAAALTPANAITAFSRSAQASRPSSDVGLAATPATPAAISAAPSAEFSFADPFAYCQSVDTVDTPDARYTGPAVPAAIASALGVTGSGADQVHWRCAAKQVLACNARHTAACELTPTVDLMLAYCSQHPDAQNLPAPNGSWSCNGNRPSIPSDQQWPVDARGYFPPAWTQVTAAQPGG